jgi:hypothetical protein
MYFAVVAVRRARRQVAVTPLLSHASRTVLAPARSPSRSSERQRRPAEQVHPVRLRQRLSPAGAWPASASVERGARMRLEPAIAAPAIRRRARGLLVDCVTRLARDQSIEYVRGHIRIALSLNHQPQPPSPCWKPAGGRPALIWSVSRESARRRRRRPAGRRADRGVRQAQCRLLDAAVGITGQVLQPREQPAATVGAARSPASRRPSARRSARSHQHGLADDLRTALTRRRRAGRPGP